MLFAGCGEGDDARTDASSAGQGGAAGDAGGQGGAAPGASCDASAGPVDPTALIDDLEDGDQFVTKIGERNGSWWLATDKTASATIQPPGDQALMPERILGGRCESEYAMRVTGEGFTTWGVSMVANFRYTTDGAPVDVSAFRGALFWARVGELHNGEVRVQFQDGNTYPQGGVCSPEPGSVDECYNGYGIALPSINEEWQLFKLEFSRMTQREFGLRGSGLDLSQVYSVEFVLAPNAVFDLWIDDVWFYE